MLNDFKKSTLSYETNSFCNIAEINAKILSLYDITEIAPPGENLFYDPRHHNSKGNKLIAEEYLNKLKIRKRKFSKVTAKI